LLDQLILGINIFASFYLLTSKSWLWKRP